MKNIVIPTDFSCSLTGTLLYGLKLMKGQESIFFLYNISREKSSHMSPLREECIYHDSLQRIQNLRKRLSRFFPTEKFSVQLVSLNEISEQIDKISLFLVSTGEFFKKNTAGNLIKEVISPVLFVPEGREFKVPGKLSVSLEPGISAKRFSLGPVIKLFGNRKFELEIQNIYSGMANPALEARDEFELKQLLDVYNPRLMKIHTSKVEEMLRKNIEKKGADLHIIPVSYHHLVSKLASPKGNSGIFKAQDPVLVIPYYKQDGKLDRPQMTRTQKASMQ